jgi:hypothetical protein
VVAKEVEVEKTPLSRGQKIFLEGCINNILYICGSKYICICIAKTIIIICILAVGRGNSGIMKFKYHKKTRLRNLGGFFLHLPELSDKKFEI